MKSEIDLEELAKFLVKAKKNAYAGSGKEITSQRPGFKELEFSQGEWNYRDSYCGFFCAPGQEIVRFQDIPVWAMSYDGGVSKIVRTDNTDYAKRIFSFLKKALSKVTEANPFRGPEVFEEENFCYINDVEDGNITRFKGVEHILEKDIEVFRQNYIGGLIISK